MASPTCEDGGLIDVEAAYAKPDGQTVVALKVPCTCSVEEVVKLSGLLERFPEIGEAELTAGIFGAVCKLDHIVHQGDRVEIYRPLRHDPKDARRQRALKK